jgi:hypothetical protein
MHRLPVSQLASIVLALLVLAVMPAGALAESRPADMLIYMPFGLVHSLHSEAEVDGYLAEIDSYGIAQVVFAAPRFKKTGILKEPRRNTEMLTRWAHRAAVYDTAHGSSLGLTIVFNGKPNARTGAFNLEDPATRANVVAGIQSSLATGAAGVQLDFEPFPAGPGFLALLEELDAMFARVGFSGRFSVVAPSNTSRWSPAYLKRVSQLVTQVNPTFYDSEYTSAAAYESWMENGLAYYTANVEAATRIVPVLPSYSANRWHRPAVENIETATAAARVGLEAGSRINGVGIWSGWGFLLDEEGAYDASADRASWLTSTLSLPFSP